MFFHTQKVTVISSCTDTSEIQEELCKKEKLCFGVRSRHFVGGSSEDDPLLPGQLHHVKYRGWRG